ncbi:hypothetical protein Anas_11361 [Armadillidium nasatum]|uniref:UPF0547 domain-containing protein n=1 Tax=Armadillidium nasatum TaxID=96803 RepID=A0A5N5STQ3_9CRUS|nr:hypothetical protein Anas_11361 [Armadillidium nasatum]
MPPKGVSKAVSKRCPECKKQIPVATRHCQCGHQFFEERRRSTASNTSEQDETEEASAVTYLGPQDPLKTEVPPPPQPSVSGSSGGDGKRRSERVKREKPNFYDSLEYDNKMRKARKERQKEEQLQQQTSGRIKRERKVKHSSEPI